MFQLEGKGLFVYSDPGGAKPVLAVASNHMSKWDALIVSDREYSFALEFGVQVKLLKESVETLISNFKPDFIFTGTSYTSDIERKFIETAQKSNIKCCSFIDHWTSFHSRFQDSSRRTIFPDYILVIDERAKEMAVKDFLPEEKLIVFGNPYFKYLSSWKPHKNKSEILHELNLNSKEKYCLLAPDPLTNTNSIEKWGFDEIEFLQKLDKELFQTGKKRNIIVKFHPNQDLNKIPFTDFKSNNFIFLSDSDNSIELNSLIYYSEIVIGFFSNMLLEAIALHKPIIRFIIHEENDPLNGHLRNEYTVNNYVDLCLKI